MTSARLKRIFTTHQADPDLQLLGKEWPAFSSYFQAIRRRGYYVSREEVDPHVAGVAAPIFNGDRLVVGALSTLFELPQGEYLDTARIGTAVMQHAATVSHRLAQPF